jgi:hypothetical protein
MEQPWEQVAEVAAVAAVAMLVLQLANQLLEIAARLQLAPTKDKTALTRILHMTVVAVAVVAEAGVEAMAVLCPAVAPMLAVMLAHTVVAQELVKIRRAARLEVPILNTTVAVLQLAALQVETQVEWDMPCLNLMFLVS